MEVRPTIFGNSRLERFRGGSWISDRVSAFFIFLRTGPKPLRLQFVEVNTLKVSQEMASDWAQRQREGAWLRPLYGRGISGRIRNLQNDSVQVQLINVLEELLSHSCPPKDCAEITACLILAQRVVDTPWYDLVGMYLNAVEDFSDEEELEVLVEYIAEIASLPDAVNTGSEAKEIDIPGGKRLISPGETIQLPDGKLWRDLPIFMWNLIESHSGKYSNPIYHAILRYTVCSLPLFPSPLSYPRRSQAQQQPLQILARPSLRKPQNLTG